MPSHCRCSGDWAAGFEPEETQPAGTVLVELGDCIRRRAEAGTGYLIPERAAKRRARSAGNRDIAGRQY